MVTIIFLTALFTVLSVCGILRYIDNKEANERKNNGFSARDLDGWMTVEHYFLSTDDSFDEMMKKSPKTMEDSVLTKEEIDELDAQLNKYSKKVKVTNDEK